ncbi:ankyrin repeat domain-containing protein [Methylobacterium indicum]|uniref:ankyrin repeat domain-containing protein n=1 Tax=Methylobacterium indicum TaxID=1775910 RepID=UPI000B101C04|nr:ankyrin repeat domain-containing protein [Methylobacterium indicum]
MDVFAQIRTNPDFQPDGLEDLSILSNDNHTLLQEAIVWRPEFAEFFMKNGAPIDHQDDKGQTALQYAIARSYNQIALSLLQKGANPNLIDQYGNNALWTAVMNPKPNYDVIAALFSANADPQRKNAAGRSPLDMARTKKNTKILQIIDR